MIIDKLSKELPSIYVKIGTGFCIIGIVLGVFNHINWAVGMLGLSIMFIIMAGGYKLLKTIFNYMDRWEQ